jgi:ATP-dependent DNA ligase
MNVMGCSTSNRYPVQYMVFDILYCNGRDLREEPLEARKTIIEK